MKVRYITVHCSATKGSMDIGAKDIDIWHRQQGYLKIGYHFVIRRNGQLETGRKLTEPGAHVKDHNTGNLGICLVGGLDEAGKATNNYTPEQFATLQRLLAELQQQFPDAQLMGHRDFPGVKKECPCFDVRKWRKENP